MRIIYMGSPKSAIYPLDYLLKHQNQSGIKIVAVVSQPAKKVGRGSKKNFQDPPLACWAKEKNLHILQPEKAGDPIFLSELKKLNPDVIVTCAYGQILSDNFLQIPNRATINIHPSKLPLFRGATPIPSTILAGYKKTAVTILFTVKKLDAGAIIVQKDYSIGDHETSGELTDRLFMESGSLLLEALEKIKTPDYLGLEQVESEVVKCGKLTKSSGKINWINTNKTIYDQYRACEPWPGSHTFLNGKRITIEKFFLLENDRAPESLPSGSFVFDKINNRIKVKCLDLWIGIETLRPEGGKSMDAKNFWNGYKSKVKELLFD